MLVNALWENLQFENYANLDSFLNCQYKQDSFQFFQWNVDLYPDDVFK